jgi:hypothetical protein
LAGDIDSVIEHPVSLPLVVLGGCDLVRVTGRAFEIRIDGRHVTTGRLPGEWLHRRRLVKYTADPTVVICNRAYTGPVRTVDPKGPGTVELAPLSSGIVGMRAYGGGHSARLELEPALPDLVQLRPDSPVEGSWRLGVDRDPAVVGGLWGAERRRDHLDLVLDVTGGWTPKGLPLLMAAVTTVALVFRRWPASYRWRATVELGDQPTMTSRWERKGHQRDRPTGGSPLHMLDSRWRCTPCSKLERPSIGQGKGRLPCGTGPMGPGRDAWAHRTLILPTGVANAWVKRTASGERSGCGG